MAVESARGCGFRKVGGLYLVATGAGRKCGKLPFPLPVCPTCGHGIKPSRGWTWIKPAELFQDVKCKTPSKCRTCPAATFEGMTSAGLLWIGEQFYPTPEHFQHESNTLGVSRRIAAIPRGFEIGKTWVFLAHRKAIPEAEEMAPGIFRVFKPERVEMIVTETDAKDAEKMEDLRKRGITPVAVPDDDPDHNPRRGKS